MAISLKTTSGKILASVALVGTAAAVAGMGTYGAFTSSTSASQAVTAGTVTIALGAPGPANTLNVPIAGLLPGDKVEKLVTLANTGNSDLNNVTLTTSAGATGSLLTTDATNGLQLTIENCSVAWTGAAAPYNCTGTKTTVLASGPGHRRQQSPGQPHLPDLGQDRQPQGHHRVPHHREQRLPRRDVHHRLLLHRHPAHRNHQVNPHPADPQRSARCNTERSSAAVPREPAATAATETPSSPAGPGRAPPCPIRSAGISWSAIFAASRIHEQVIHPSQFSAGSPEPGRADFGTDLLQKPDQRKARSTQGPINARPDQRKARSTQGGTPGQ